MDGFIGARALAGETGIPLRTVQRWFATGRIPRARKLRGVWVTDEAAAVAVAIEVMPAASHEGRQS